MDEDDMELGKECSEIRAQLRQLKLSNKVGCTRLPEAPLPVLCSRAARGPTALTGSMHAGVHTVRALWRKGVCAVHGT
jgi:hypothetical protein